MVFDAAVAALHAAGDDEEALAEAVTSAEAAGLDGAPGEDRQKLRGEGCVLCTDAYLHLCGGLGSECIKGREPLLVGLVPAAPTERC